MTGDPRPAPLPSPLEPVPAHLREGLRGYLRAGIPPGAFLRAVLSNDLIGAVKTGDADSLAGLVPLVRFLYNKAPIGCWGSADAVAAWIGTRGRR